jgi:hypothetical protein
MVANMRNESGLNVRTPAVKAIKSIAAVSLFLLFSACAHHPKKDLPLPPAPAIPSTAQVRAAANAVQACLHGSAYRVDDGVSSSATLGDRVAQGCIEQLHTWGVLKSRQTRDQAGAWVIYQSTMMSAVQLGTDAIDQVRALEYTARH